MSWSLNICSWLHDCSYFIHSFIHSTNPFMCPCRVSAGRVLCDVCSHPAVKTCLTCRDSYCGTCIRPHYSDPDLERHQLQDLQDQSLCEQHQRQLEFYCRTDQSAICSLCFLKDHKGHDVVEQVGTYTDRVWCLCYYTMAWLNFLL